jgi:hypothetical protein
MLFGTALSADRLVWIKARRYVVLVATTKYHSNGLRRAIAAAIAAVPGFHLCADLFDALMAEGAQRLRNVLAKRVHPCPLGTLERGVFITTD